MIHWFGTPFNPVCTPEMEVPTPVGRKCAWCEESIDADESGAAFPSLDAHGRCSYVIYHSECMFRHLAGSVGHLQQRCSCYGQEDTSELGLSLREAAIETWKYYCEHNRVTVH